MKTELWRSYLADYDRLPGSTLVNLAMKPRAPMQDHSTLLVTGVSYQSSPKNSGLPDASELDFLNRLGAKRLTLLAEHSQAIFVGSFTHKNERLDYTYVANPAELEATLRDFYQTECPARRPYINVKSDPHWDAYLNFLYPKCSDHAALSSRTSEVRGTLNHMTRAANEITGANAGGRRQLLPRRHWAARIAQFRRWAWDSRS